jgi:hypothetical protein
MDTGDMCFGLDYSMRGELIDIILIACCEQRSQADSERV